MSYISPRRLDEYHKGAVAPLKSGKADKINYDSENSKIQLLAENSVISETEIKSVSSEATTTTAGLMSAADKTKLNGIEAGAQVNKITGVKGSAESSYRTGNVNITAANVGAAASTHSHSEATTSAAGFMSAADKTKLDSLKPGQVINLSKTGVTLTLSSLTATVTASVITGNGTLSVSSDDTSIATASISGSSITITAKGNGFVSVRVTAGETSSYAKTTTEIGVNVSGIPKELNETDWSEISRISQAGLASSIWDIGDCKAVTLNGTVGTLSLSNVTVYAYILGFDHNSGTEGKGIQFGCFKTAKTDGTDICLTDNAYNSTKSDGTKCFNMNHWGTSSSPYNTNYGGWAACDMRYDILGSTNQAPSGYGATKTTSASGSNPTSSCATSPVANTLMAALPSALRAVMKPITKYTDNTGNLSTAAANVTATTDYLPLLSEYEVRGSRSYANSNEQSKQTQYQYYKNGNSKVKKKHSDTASAATWWVRSPCASNASHFCGVGTDGGAYFSGSRYSLGVAPAFMV